MSTRGAQRRLLWATALLVAVLASGLAAIRYAPAGAETPLWWPAAGFSVALLAVTPRRAWWALVPALAGVGWLVHYTDDATPVVAGALGASYALAALAAGWCLTRGAAAQPALRRQDDVLRLLVGAALGAGVAAVGVATTSAMLLDGPFVTPLATALASHAAAILVLTPLALGRDRPADDLGRGQWPRVEGALQWLVLVGTAAYVFSPAQTLGLAFLAVSALGWAALRVGPRTVAWQLLVVAVIATVSTQRGGGPFAVGTATGVSEDLLAGWLVQGFLVACAVVTLPLAVAVEHRRCAVRELTASEELFHKTFTESLVGMLLLRRKEGGRLEVVEANAVAAAILGGSAEDLHGEDWTSMLSTSASLSEVTADLASGQLGSWRADVALSAQPWCRLSVSLTPLSRAHGGPGPDGRGDQMFTAQMMDVTATHEATARLRTEKDLSAAILDTAGCLIVLVALDGTVVGMNRAAQAVSGFGDEDVRDRPLWETLVPKDHRTTVELMFGDPTGAAVPTSQESDLRTKNGGRRRVVWSNAFLTDERGRRTHVVMTGIDVTSQRATTGLLTHLLGAATRTAFVATDLNGRVTVFNAGAQRLFGYPARDMVGRQSPDRLLDPEQLAARATELGMRPGFAVLVAETADGAEPLTRDWTCVRKDGTRVTVALTVSTVKDAVGRHIGYLAVGEDVTARRRSETELLAALEREREEVGRLTLSALDADDTPVRSELDLRAVVSRGYDALGPVLDERDLKAWLELPEAPVTVRGSAEQLERMVGHLLDNAVTFTEDGGQVWCRLAVQGDDAVLEISDTGIGIPVDEQKDLFVRYFRASTALERGIDGAGLGLSVVESVVRTHEGDITVRSAAQEGSTFTVRIPLAHQRTHYAGKRAAR
jgi:PAS domain S-box-containing protein